MGNVQGTKWNASTKKKHAKRNVGNGKRENTKSNVKIAKRISEGSGSGSTTTAPTCG